jgi:hypothetical protein
MIWIAPSEKDHDSEALEKRLWAAADQLRANSGLTSQQYSQPVLGLIFLRFSEVRFAARQSEPDKRPDVAHGLMSRAPIMPKVSLIFRRIAEWHAGWSSR